MEAKEKLTQRLGIQTIHKIVPSYVSSLLEGDVGDECHAPALFVLQYLHVCLVKTRLCLEGLGQGCPSREYTNLRMCLLKVAMPLIKCAGGR